MRLKDFEASSLRHRQDRLEVLDQTALPDQEIWVECNHPEQMEACIKSLQIRGAPMIAFGACFVLAKMATKGAERAELEVWLHRLKQARPTAVNLERALNRMKAKLSRPIEFVAEAVAIFEEDRDLCESMSTAGAELIEENDQILTHCNTGGLATAGRGTALGVIHKAFSQDKNIHVYVDETRPLLQGARLTTWELSKAKILYTLITDSMAGFLMKQKKVDKIFVGADRIAMNGDTANKIGTYSLAVLAKAHDIPFYVVAPRTTLDPQLESGDLIPIEERRAEEVLGLYMPGKPLHEWSTKGSKVYNPAFDITPAALITGWVFDTGVLSQKEVSQGVLKKTA